MNKNFRRYVVVSPLNHDGVDIEIGAAVDLCPEQAAPLLGHTVKEAKALSGRDLIDAKVANMKGGAQ